MSDERAELVAMLRDLAEAVDFDPHDLGIPDAGKLRRAAELLQAGDPDG